MHERRREYVSEKFCMKREKYELFWKKSLYEKETSIHWQWKRVRRFHHNY